HQLHYLLRFKDYLTLRFLLYKQLDVMDCGPTCLRMAAKYYGLSISLDYLCNKLEYSKQGFSIISEKLLIDS
ncbi:MAG: cysteine peptidase family C39 domain-containing protein, partial [Sphingobacteriales bacterium]